MPQVKLTDKQKEVIKLMRKGCILYKGLGAHGKYWVTGDNYSKYHSKPIITSLVKAEVIQITNTGRHWQLTDLGKTIDIL